MEKREEKINTAERQNVRRDFFLCGDAHDTVSNFQLISQSYFFEKFTIRGFLEILWVDWIGSKEFNFVESFFPDFSRTFKA